MHLLVTAQLVADAIIALIAVCTAIGSAVTLVKALHVQFRAFRRVI